MCPRSGVVAERTYPRSEVSGGREETLHVQGQGRQPREATLHLRPLDTERSHRTPEARGSSPEEPPRDGGQGRHLRPGVEARRSNPKSSGCAGAGGPRGAIPC